MRSLLLPFTALLLTITNAQQWNWAADAGGGGNTDFCFGIATDSQGNVYWCGSVSGTAEFGCATIAPGNNVVGVLAKYDPSGTCQWVRSMGTTFDYSWTYNVAIDAQDRIYVTGSYNGNATFGDGVTLNSISGDDIFLARYTVNGNCLWARRAGTSSSDEARGIAVSDDGSVFISGFCGTGTIAFDPISIPSSGRQIVVARYDSTGAVQWAKASTGSGNKSARAIAVSGDRLFVTGQILATDAAFDGLPFPAYGVYVLACDLDGDPLWVRSYGSGDHEGMGIAADTLGNVFVVGRMWGDLFLPDDTLASVSGDDDMLFMGLNQDGDYRWAKSRGGVDRDVAWGVAADGLGNAYVAAHFNYTIDFFGTTLIPLGSEDILIAKLEADGDVVWAQRPSGFQRDIPLCIHRQAEAPHKLYFGGYFWGAITYGSTTIDDVLNGDAMIVSGIDTTFDVSLAALPSCFESCSGVANAFVTGDGPFSFAWLNGLTTPGITGLCPDEYIIEVTDANGQMLTDTIVVGEVGDPGYTVEQNGNTLSIAGGIAYTWYFNDMPLVGADSSSIEAVATGNYWAFVTTPEGCVYVSDTLNFINVGIDPNLEEFEAVVIFPSPATDHIMIHASVPAREVFAVNTIGARTPLRTDASGQFDVRILAPGIYALHIRLRDDRWLARTFIKE
ncbi:MAG: SBBP repeat-containing protein [Flavobacteriales bacterium]